jgi:hypothetical protein
MRLLGIVGRKDRDDSIRTRVLSKDLHFPRTGELE